MDAIAKKAGLTKPTLYQYFKSKDVLFKAMMTLPRDQMMLVFEEHVGIDHVEQLLIFATRYAETVMDPDFLSLARLTIGEAPRFPEVGRAYQRSGPDKVLAGLMKFMERLKAEGRLEFEEAELAAQDFWGLILSAPRNQALHEPDNIPGAEQIERYIRNGVKIFLKAYASDPERDLARLEKGISVFD